ncbi:MAG: DUF7309 domain-containing protein [Bacteroidota bacterium]
MTKLELWKKIYSLCDEFFSQNPWKIFYEDDVFAVKSPESGNEYFISIMGSNEEVYAMSAYEGADALYQFWNLHEREDLFPPETIMLIPHMMVSLDDRENIPQKQRSVIKELGLTYRGRKAWPNVERIIPAYLPIIPDDSHLHDLVHILEQSIHVIKRASKNKAFIHNEERHEDDYLFREAKPDNGGWIWKDVYRRVPAPVRKEEITYTKKQLSSFKELPVSNHELEMDLVMVPAPVKDKGQTAYFPFVFMLVDPEKATILDFEFLPPHPDFHSMLGKLPDTILGKIVKTGRRPHKINYKSPYIEGIMKWLKEETGQKTEQKSDMPALDDAVEFMIDQMTE